jgi:hypothetical protein
VQLPPWAVTPQPPLAGQLAHAAFAREQFAVLPPWAPAQVQVELLPQDPATLLVLVPVVQPYCTLLLQLPLTGQAALAFEQLVSLVPPPVPTQLQVELPPQDPATLAALVPVVQPYCTLLLQLPLTAQAAFASEQLAVDPPPVPEHVQVALPPHDPAL